VGGVGERRKGAAREARLVSYAEAIYSKAAAKFPASQTLLVAYADFMVVRWLRARNKSESR